MAGVSLRKLSEALTTAIKVILSASILFVLFRKAELSESLQHITQIRFSFIILSIVFIVIGQVVRAHRLSIMVFGDSAGERFAQVMRIQMVSFLPGAVSPAKVGEATKVYMLKSEADVPVDRGFGCFVAERVLDLLLLGTLAVIGLSVFFRSGLRFHTKSGWFWLSVEAAAVLAVTVIIVFVVLHYRKVSLVSLWASVRPQRAVEAVAMTVVYWGIVFLEVWCFCKAALFDAHVWHPVLVVPPALLTSIIPITFSGFGLREAALIILFQRPPVGTNYEQALLISVMYDIVGLGIPALMGVLFWLSGKRDGAPEN